MTCCSSSLVFLKHTFSLEQEPEPAKKNLEPEPVKNGPAPQHCLSGYSSKPLCPQLALAAKPRPARQICWGHALANSMIDFSMGIGQVSNQSLATHLSKCDSSQCGPCPQAKLLLLVPPAPTMNPSAWSTFWYNTTMRIISEKGYTFNLPSLNI